MDVSKRAREGQTPGRTPGKNDFKRPAFELGRISFGVDDDSSSSSAEENDLSPRDARSTVLLPPGSRLRVPQVSDAGDENGNSSSSLKMVRSSSFGFPTASRPVRSSILADRSLRENERLDVDEEDHYQQHSPFANPMVASARPAGRAAAAGNYVSARDCLSKSRNESRVSLIVAGGKYPKEASSAAAVSRDAAGQGDSDSHGDDAFRSRASGKFTAVSPAHAETASCAGDGAQDEGSPAGSASPGGDEEKAGSEDFPQAWDDGGGMYYDYGDYFGSGGVFTCSPSPSRGSPTQSRAAGSAGGVGDSVAGPSSVFSCGRRVSNNTSCSSSNSHAKTAAGGKSAGGSPIDTSYVFDLSLASSPPPPTSRFFEKASHPKSPTPRAGATTGRKGKASEEGVVCCNGSEDDDDDFVDCLEVVIMGSPNPVGRGGGVHGRGHSDAGSNNPTSRYSGGGSIAGGNGGRGGSGSGRGCSNRFDVGSSSSSPVGGVAALHEPNAFGPEFHSSGSDDDDFSMVASKEHITGSRAISRGAVSTNGTAGASTGASSSVAGSAAGDAGAYGGGGGGHGRYGDLAGVTGEWELDANGQFWKMEALGGGGVDVESDDEGDSEGTTRKAFSVPSALYDRMYPHQTIGVRWLWGLHQGDMGGILGDDMGLGKTFQVTCFLAGLFRTKQAKCALVLAPKSVMRGWEDELGRWLVKATCPKAEVIVMASEMPAKQRKRAIALAANGGSRGKGAVLVTTYGMVSSNPEQFAPATGGAGGWIERGRSQQHVWDYVILDEGHKIKNSSTKTCEAVHSLPTRRRLILTGTPVQNNLRELYTVVDWATFGKLLGPYKHFKTTFSKPIEYGQDKNASEKAVLRSRARAAALRQLLEPLLLQRTKGEIMDEKATTKTEMVVWVALSPRQREMYASYLGGESVKHILSGEVSSPLSAIAHLKKVCLHPVVSSYPLDEPWTLDPDASVSSLLKDCSKLQVTLSIIKEACGTGHRVLVFSRFVRMLDIIERCVREDEREGGAGLRLCRIDGTHSDVERQHTISRFNGNDKISVCVVSTGAGGTGITLTGADRVILFDPSWNPADDMQAVDRAYRIGQKRDVIVYRMIAAGTVEEKMYEKQIFKDGLRRTVMGGNVKRKKNVRYFSRAELKQLFTLFPAGECRVLDQLEGMHGTLSGRLEAAESPAQRKISLDGHLDFVCGLRGAYGASAHGDGLPKIIQPAAQRLGGSANRHLGSGSGDNGGWHGRNQIDDEADESDAEDSGGDHDVRARRQRGALLSGLLRRSQAEEELTALEIDLDGGDDGDDEYGGGGGVETVGPSVHTAGRKGKGPLRLRRQPLSGIDSETTDDGDVIVKERKDMTTGAGGSVLDLSVAGANESTAIALSCDSSSEVEWGSGDGTSNKNDVVELLDENDDDDDGNNSGGSFTPLCLGSTRTPAASKSESGNNSGDFFGEDFDEAGSWPMSPPATSSLPNGDRLANSDRDSPTTACRGDDESPVPASRSLSEVGGQHKTDDKQEQEDQKATMEASNEHGYPTSLPSSHLATFDHHVDVVTGTSPTAMEGGDNEASAAVKAGRESAWRWATEELGISPTASAPSDRQDGGDNSGGETTESDEDGAAVGRRRVGAGAVSRKSAAVRERARNFAAEEIGAGSAGRPCSSSHNSSSADEAIGRCNLRDMEGEAEKKRQEDCSCGGYRSSDDSMEAVPPNGGAGDEEGEEEGEDRQSRVGNGGVRVVEVEGEEEDNDESDSFRSAMMVDSSSPTAAIDDSIGASSMCKDSLDTAAYSSARSSLASLAESDMAAGDDVEGGGCAEPPPGYRSPGGDPLEEGGDAPLSCPLRKTMTPNEGDKRSTPKFGTSLCHGQADRVEGGEASPRSSYETAGSVQQQEEEAGGMVVSLAGVGEDLRERGDEYMYDDEVNLGSSQSASRTHFSRCWDGIGPGDGEGFERSERRGGGGGGFNRDIQSGVKGWEMSPIELRCTSPPPAPAVCTAHKVAAESAGFTCLRCSCGASAEEVEQATGLLLKAWAKEKEGDMYAAMDACLDAIKLFDDDMELHKTIARIGSRLFFFS